MSGKSRIGSGGSSRRGGGTGNERGAGQTLVARDEGPLVAALLRERGARRRLRGRGATDPPDRHREPASAPRARQVVPRRAPAGGWPEVPARRVPRGV